MNEAQTVAITQEPHHKQSFENRHVRLFRVEVSPGESTIPHRHDRDYVMVIFGTSEIENNVFGKTPVRTRLNDGDTSYIDGGFAHTVQNVGSTPFRNVTVEFVRRGRSSPEEEDARGIDLMEGGSVQTLFAKKGVWAHDTELRAGAAEHAHAHEAGYVLVAITDLELHDGQQTRRLQAGDAVWMDAGTHALKNAGQQTARFISIEFGPRRAPQASGHEHH